MSSRTRASTDGVEPQVASRPAGEGEASNSNHASGPGNEDAGGTVQAAPTHAPDPVPATLEQKPTDNMSAHIVHAELLANETQIKIAAYESGIITLQSELNGAEQEKNKAIAKIEAEFLERATELARRLDDLLLTKEMLTGSLVVRDRRRSERDDTARKEAFNQEEQTDDTTQG